MSERPERVIHLRKERQPDGLRFRKLREDETYDQMKDLALKLPGRGSVFESSVKLPADELSIEELRQLSVWVGTGSPPLVGREATDKIKKRGGLPQKRKAAESRVNPKSCSID